MFQEARVSGTLRRRPVPLKSVVIRSCASNPCPNTRSIRRSTDRVDRGTPRSGGRAERIPAITDGGDDRRPDQRDDEPHRNGELRWSAFQDSVRSRSDTRFRAENIGDAHEERAAENRLSVDDHHLSVPRASAVGAGDAANSSSFIALCAWHGTGHDFGYPSRTVLTTTLQL